MRQQRITSVHDVMVESRSSRVPRDGFRPNGEALNTIFINMTLEYKAAATLITKESLSLRLRYRFYV